MRTWLKRMVAGIVSAGTLMGGGLLMAGTANADEIRMPDIGKTITSLTASAATTYPRGLVNGGFDYLPAGGWNVISPKLNTSRGKFTSVDPVNGQYIRNAHVTDGNVAWVKWDGFDASKFGWISDQKGGKPQGFVTDHANSVELQRDNDTDNTYAEIVGSEIGKSIYQKIDTQNSTDAVYTVRFDHAALSSEHADGMQALVNGKPVTMTRIGGNKAGDKTGWTGTDIVTHATNTDHYRHDGQWATYEGKVTIPANTPVSTFTFKSLNEAKPDMGNLIDNLTFKIAYRLSYDSNGGTKAKASQISSMTEGKASETDGKVKTVADDAAGRTVLECKRSGEGATGPYADKFCWIDWSNLPLNRTGEPIPVRINVPDGHIDADATVAHTDNAALTAKDYTGNKWSRLIPAYRLTGNTALAFSRIQGNSADPLASVMFSNITPVVNQTATSVNVLKDFQLAFGDAETMSGYVVNDKKIYEQTDIESDKTLDKLGMIGDNNPNQSYSEANTGYGTTHVTLAGGPAGAHALTDEADSKGAAVIGATQPTRFKVSFKQVNHPADDSWSAIAIGVYMPYLTAYPLTYDKNGRDATGSVPSNETAGTVRQTKSKTNGSVRLAADDDVAEYAANGLPDHLVNGDFEYPVKSDMPANDGKFWYISQNDGSYFANGTVKRYKLPEGFDKAKFAWHSTQTGDTSYPDLERADDVQVDYKADGTNHYSEISAAQSGATIYQDVATVPGAMYKWSLKHASLDSSHLDKMSVIIGEPGKETAQEATRTTANGHGDKLGKVGTVISTKVSNPENKFQEGAHTGQWETYTGTYIATGTVTRFTFKSVSSSNNVYGNILDDLSFTKAYRLGYDGNGGTGQVPSRTETGRTETAASGTDGTVRLAADKSAGPESGTIADDRRVLTDTTARQDDGTSQRTITRSDGSVRVETIATTGAVSGCQVYYPAGTRITLATAKADSDCWDSSQIGKTNRTFYGWSANTDANDRDVPVGDTMDRNTLNANVRTEIVMPARAKTVYALWAINPTLSYNVNAPAGSNAPGTPASQTVPYNTAAADKSGWAAGDTGKIPGYRFDGWYTAPNGGNKYDFNTPLTGNVTVYAHWVGNGYTVRFAGNGATGGGTPDQAFQYNIGQNLHRNGFVRDGYTFTGWKRADNQQAYGDGQWVTNLTTQPNGIVTMVAQWSANEAHIRYNPNPPAGKTTGGQGTPNWDGHTGDTPTIGQNGWTIDGYTFAGWATSPDGSGARYAPGARWTANGTLTLYAQWTPGQASLTYDGNGATGGKTDPQTGKTDEKINVRDNGFTRDGYTFVTWNTQADCKGNAVKPNSEWTLRGSSTLYACWAGNAQTLTYHGNGATGGNTAAQSGKTGDELTTNANGFTRDGYTFVRWDTAKDGSGTAYGEGKNGVSQYVMKPAGNDLYAIWKANPATIQYRNDWPNTTGSTPDTTGNTGDTVTISQNSFDRPGYTFTGWSTSKRGDPSLQPGDKHTLEPRTTTVWAQWKADPAHLVYNSNIGTVGSETKTVDGVVDQTVKTITNPFDRPGYTFSGWNTQADGKGKAYATGADYVLTANDKSTPKNTSVLYAQWKINGASLKFNPNGGIGHVDDVTGDAFSTVTIPGDAKEPKITRPGYRFVGWSTEKNPPAGSTFLQPGEGKVTLPAEGSTTVYAQWEPSLTTLPFTGGQAQVPTIWLYAGFALMLIALGVMMPMLRMRMAATKRTGKHMPITGGKHAK